MAESFSPKNAALSALISGKVYLPDLDQWVDTKQAFANPSAIGNTVLVAAVTGKKIRVLAFAFVSTLANSVKFQSATTDKSATFPVAANGGLSAPWNPAGWFETNAGEALNVNLSVATATGVQATFVEV